GEAVHLRQHAVEDDGVILVAEGEAQPLRAGAADIDRMALFPKTLFDEIRRAGFVLDYQNTHGHGHRTDPPRRKSMICKVQCGATGLEPAAPLPSRRDLAVRERYTDEEARTFALELEQHGASVLFLRIRHGFARGVYRRDVDLVDPHDPVAR